MAQWAKVPPIKPEINFGDTWQEGLIQKLYNGVEQAWSVKQNNSQGTVCVSSYWLPIRSSEIVLSHFWWVAGTLSWWWHFLLQSLQTWSRSWLLFPQAKEGWDSGKGVMRARIGAIRCIFFHFRISLLDHQSGNWCAISPSHSFGSDARGFPFMGSWEKVGRNEPGFRMFPYGEY